MKLYDYIGAPNPRRVRIFLAEKGLSIQTVQVDLRAAAQFSDEFRAINPRCTVPALLLDDGTVLGEVNAIWRYLEDTNPSPPLMGSTPTERASVAMWAHRCEIDGLLAVAEAVRNAAPGLKGRALVGPHGFDQIPALVERGRARTHHFLRDLDLLLEDRPYIAGDTFSVADITAVVTIDFAAERLKIEVPEDYRTLRSWYERVSKRPSMDA